MPYTVNCNPAPLTFTIRPKFGWESLVSIAWVGFVGFQIFFMDWRKAASENIPGLVVFGVVSFGICMAFIRRERIEIYSEQMVWRKTYFGITRSVTAPLNDVLGAEWSEGDTRGRQGKGPNYVEFFLSDRSVKACFGFSFDDFDRMRDDIRTMYPQLVKRWGQSSVRSKDLTLLNLS